MVLKLSDLVQKSIDKGYSAASQNIEKPWSQGNLSMIDLKTGTNPFVKNVVREEQPILHSSSASLQKQQEKQQTSADNKWWEQINFSDTTEPKSRKGRLLVNHALLKDYA